MTTQNISLFKALGAKMDFLNQRQRVISQNIANTDTPGYRPKDLKAVDFSSYLKGTPEEGNLSVRLDVTDDSHQMSPEDAAMAKARKQRETYEVAPAGNAVIVEEQLLNSNQTIGDYTLMTNLYQKHVGMIKIALGTQR